jgi:hypothetical protein
MAGQLDGRLASPDTMLSGARMQDTPGALRHVSKKGSVMRQKEIITWFEIPAGDLKRAQRFYGELLHTEFKIERMGLSTMAVFPRDSGVGGCLTSDSSAPGAAGSIVYLKVDQAMDDVLQRVDALGGRIVWCKTELPGGMGYYAHILDTEGNRIGLHSMN